jgi:CheY-like chemotaxis protein
MSKKILWLDNDLAFLKPYKTALEREGHEVTARKTVSEAEELINKVRYDLLVLDVMIPTKSDQEEEIYPPGVTGYGHQMGLFFYRRMKDKLDDAGTPVLVMTVRIDKDLSDDFAEAGLPRENFALKSRLCEVSTFVEKVKEVGGW